MLRLLLIAALVALVYSFVRSRRVAAWPFWALPAILLLVAVLYVRSPVDLIPGAHPVGLLDDLLVMGGSLWYAARRFLSGMGASRAHAAEAHDPIDEPQWDPYDVLGLQPGASRDEITAAYREMMKRYHPDRVGDLGEELQDMAHRKSIEIRKAFEELGGR